MERSYKKRALLEIVMKIVFLAAACMSVLCVALICIFLFANGLPAMGEIGVLNFLSGTRWKPGADIYGIFPMILGSIYVTAGALLMGVPVALLTAIDLAFFCPKKLYRVLKPAVELLAGIPSVVYGFFGIVVLVPMVRALGEKGRKRQLDAHRVHPAGDHDSADDHRRGRACAARRAEERLRGRAGAGRDA